MNLVVNVRFDKCDVYVGRGSIYGNPYSHMPRTRARYRVSSRVEALLKYEEWLRAHPGIVERAKRELKDKVLGCWCAPLPCHASILARIANE